MQAGSRPVEMLNRTKLDGFYACVPPRSFVWCNERQGKTDIPDLGSQNPRQLHVIHDHRLKRFAIDVMT